MEVLQHERHLRRRDVEAARYGDDLVVGHARQVGRALLDGRHVPDERDPVRRDALLAGHRQPDDGAFQLLDADVRFLRVLRQVLARVRLVVADDVGAAHAAERRAPGRRRRLRPDGRVSVEQRHAVRVRQVDEAGRTGARLGHHVPHVHRARAAKEAVSEPAVGVAARVVRSRLLEQLAHHVPQVGGGSGVHQLGVRADQQDGRVGRQLVQRLQPQLQAAHVAREQVLRAVLQLERRQVDGEQEEVDLHSAAVVVEQVVRKHDGADVARLATAAGRRAAHLELVDLEGGLARRRVLLAQALVGPQRLHQRRLARVRLAHHADGDVAARRRRRRRRLRGEEVLESKVREQLALVVTHVARPQRQVVVVEAVQALDEVDEARLDDVEPVVADVEHRQLGEVRQLVGQARDAVARAAQRAQVRQADDPRDAVEPVVAEGERLEAVERRQRQRQRAQARPLRVAREAPQVAQVADLVGNLLQLVAVDA